MSKNPSSSIKPGSKRLSRRQVIQFAVLILRDRDLSEMFFSNPDPFLLLHTDGIKQSVDIQAHKLREAVNEQLAQWLKEVSNEDVKKYLKDTKVLDPLNSSDRDLSVNEGINFQGVTIPKVLIGQEILDLSKINSDYSFDAQGAVFEVPLRAEACPFTNGKAFKGAKFEQKVNFGNARFQQNDDFSGMDFSGVVFEEDVSFRGVKFQRNADFSDAIFEGEVDLTRISFENVNNNPFDKATFKKKITFGTEETAQPISFNGAVFDVGLCFEGCTFENGQAFKGAKFEQKVNFKNAHFQKNADFSGAIFHQEANFDRTIFEKDADFTGVIFHQEADFGLASFKKWAIFKKVKADGRLNFSGVAFKEGLNFSGAHFYGAPPCLGGVARDARLAFDTKTKFFGPKNRKNNPKKEKPDALREARDWRILKQFADYHHEKDFARDLFKYELEAQSKGGTGWFNCALTMGYKWISDYGFGIGLPSLWLVGLAIIAGLFHLLTACLSGVDVSVWEIIAHVTQTGIFPFFASGDPYLAKDWHWGLTMIQRFLSLILVFLIGLGVRNYFRIRL